MTRLFREIRLYLASELIHWGYRIMTDDMKIKTAPAYLVLGEVMIADARKGSDR